MGRLARMAEGQWLPRVLVISAALFTVGWLLVSVIPGAQGLMLDFVASFLLNIAVMGLLWCAAGASVGRPAANDKGRPVAAGASVGRPAANDKGRPAANDQRRAVANSKGRAVAAGASVGRAAANDQGRAAANGAGAPAARGFWRALAIAWTLNIAGNIAWGVHDILTAERLGIFTWIDGIYLARYAMIGWALWHYPREPERWTDYAAVTLVATMCIWATLFRVMRPSIPQRPFWYFMGGALYPILDTALIYAALMAWLRIGAGAGIKRSMGLFALAMFVYGAANWINFTVRAIALDASSDWAAFFWLLADGFTGLAAFLVVVFRPVPEQKRGSGRSLSVRWTAYIPYVASVLALGIMVVDWIVRAALDGVLIVCTIAILGIAVYDAVISPALTVELGG